MAAPRLPFVAVALALLAVGPVAAHAQGTPPGQSTQAPPGVPRPQETAVTPDPSTAAAAPGEAGQAAPVGHASPAASLLLAINIEGAEVTVDDRPIGTSPVAAIEVAPGRHTVAVTARGFAPFRTSVEVDLAEAARLNVDLTPDAAALSRIEEEEEATAGGESEGPWYSRWYVIGGGVAAVVLVTAIVVVAATSGGDEGPLAYPVPPIQ